MTLEMENNIDKDLELIWRGKEKREGMCFWEKTLKTNVESVHSEHVWH